MTPNDLIPRFMLAALVAVAALILVGTAHSSTPRDADRAAWYLKGEGDVLIGGKGWTISRLTCTRTTGVYVGCRLKINSLAASSLCSRGLFRVSHFHVDGQWTKPKPCGAPPS